MPDDEETQSAPAGATNPVRDEDDVIDTFRKIAKTPPSPSADPETGEERHPS